MKHLRALILIIIGVFWTLGFSPAPKAQAPEVRALWVTRFELADPANIPVLVQKAAEANFNALFVQVCGRGTAYWDSKILPRDSQALRHDALSLLITEAKKHNISVHAWINTLYVWSASTPPESPRHIVNLHPEWLMYLPEDPQSKYLDPAIPAVRDYVRSIYKEVALNYAVDGVHLDYVRYPGTATSLTAYSRQAFQKQFGIDPLTIQQNKNTIDKQYVQRWDDYRQEAVSTLVRSIYLDITSTVPEVVLSAAVLADPESAKRHNFQDWAGWMRDGYIDIIVPMIYDTRADVVQRQITRAGNLASTYKTPVFAGLGAWRRSALDITADVKFVRQLNTDNKYLQGVVLFSYDGIKDTPHYLEHLKQNVFIGQAALPAQQIRQYASHQPTLELVQAH